MKRPIPVRGYRGGYLIGFITIAVIALRAVTNFQTQPHLNIVILILVLFNLLYTSEPLLQSRLRWFRYIYFPFQTGLVLALTNLQPFLDISSVLYMPLALQAVRAFSRPAVMVWMATFVVLLIGTLTIGMGWAPGLALALLILAGGVFMVSYDLLYTQTQSDYAESEMLLSELQQAHQKLEEYADQAEELATMRERNRLAGELHDSISQLIFSIRLNAQAAKALIDRDPARLPEQLDRLQDLTGGALQQMRAFITELHFREES